jgi:hypothetical protein
MASPDLGAAGRVVALAIALLLAGGAGWAIGDAAGPTPPAPPSAHEHLHADAP